MNEKLLGHVGRVNTCRFLDPQKRDSGYIASGGEDGLVRLYNCFKSTNPLHSFKGGHSQGDILDVCFAAGGGKLASVGLDRAAVIWDVTSGTLHGRLHGHSSRINCVAFRDNDPSLLVTGSHDSTIRCWDVRQRSCIQVLPRFKDSVTGIFADDSSIVGCALDGSILSFDVRVGTVNKDESIFPLGSFCRSRDGKCVLVSCVKEQAELRILGRATGTTLRRFSGHVNTSLSLAVCFDHEDAHVGCGSEDGIVRFWNLVSGQVVKSLKVENQLFINGITHHPARDCFVICGAGGFLQCYFDYLKS